MHDTAKVLAQLDGYSFIKEWFPEAPPPDPASGELAVRCPFHADGTPSLHFNVREKVYHCKGCDAKGTAVDLHAFLLKVPRPAAVAHLAATLGVFDDQAIAATRVEALHVALKLNAAARAALWERKGLDDHDVQTWRLGWDAEQDRLVIPVRDAHGVVVNLRGYDLLRKHPDRKYTNLKGHGEARLWPLEALATPGAEVVLTEGELKMIGLRRRGFNAVTTTGGARTWAREFTPQFAGLHVALVYDVDATGRDQAARRAAELHGVAASVRVVALPLDAAAHPHGDVLDYLVKAGGTTEALRALLAATPPWEPPAAAPEDLTVYPVELAHASRAEFYDKRVGVDGLVSAKDQAPFVVPKRLEIRCARGMEICSACPVGRGDGPQPYVAGWAPDDKALLQLLDVDLVRQRRAVAEQLGIPSTCRVHEQIILEAHNVEEVRVEPPLDAAGAYGGATTERASVRAYHVGHGLQEGAAYRLTARATVDPRDQHATLLAYAAKENVDNLATFAPTDEELRELLIFQPTAWTPEALAAKLDDVYDDLAHNVTRIFRRPDVHLMFDLVWHSALGVTLDGEVRKGWVDALILGDSGQGKSETALRLLAHYGLGELVDMKGATEAGLKGGLKEVGGRWWTEWGVAPKNDRRALVLDEVKGAAPEVLQALTSMRSSGVAELVKIERRKAWARTRLLWVSNPRAPRGMATYNHGVLAIKELMGSLEDVRRFDAALIVASPEVAQAEINAELTRRATAPLYTRERCRRLVLWAWTRKPAQIVVEDAAYQRCLARAADHAARFDATIPLVEPADHRFKLARLATALAARTWSTDDETGQQLIVRPAHVDYVADFLTRIYSARYMGYAEFSRVTREDQRLGDEPFLRGVLGQAANPRHLARGLLGTTAIRQQDFVDWLGTNRDHAQRILSALVNAHAIARRGGDYYKSAEFLEFLRRYDAELDARPAPTRGEDY